MVPDMTTARQPLTRRWMIAHELLIVRRWNGSALFNQLSVRAGGPVKDSDALPRAGGDRHEIQLDTLRLHQRFALLRHGHHRGIR